MKSVPPDDTPESDREAAAAYRRLVEGATDTALFMLDPEGTVTMWPAVARTLYGYGEDDAVGRSLDTLFADTDRSPGLAELLADAKDRAREVEGWHERADGSVFWATTTLSPVRDDVFHGYTVVSRDTTARKQYERMLERQNDRLKEFADIISHDLRSPLTVIDGRLALYEETGEPEHLEVIEETTDRMEALVEDLLRVARQGQVVEHPEPTDIDAVLGTAVEGTLPEDATCGYESVPRVMADETRLVQLFENLLRNSVDHGGGSVAVRVGPLGDGFYVEDDGPGIPEGDRERVFEHGFTTRADGTGYGLSVVRSIVGAHGWDVVVTDAEGGGARFEVTGIEFVDAP